MSRRLSKIRLALEATRLHLNSAVITMDANHAKDPDPKNWRTISGAKVHLTKGKIDGGAGGKFTGKKWSGKHHHQFTPGASKKYKAAAGEKYTPKYQGYLDEIKKIVEQSKRGKGKPTFYQNKIDNIEQKMETMELFEEMYEKRNAQKNTNTSNLAPHKKEEKPITHPPNYSLLDPEGQTVVDEIALGLKLGHQEYVSRYKKQLSDMYGIDVQNFTKPCKDFVTSKITQDEFSSAMADAIADGLTKEAQKDLKKVQEITKTECADFTKMPDKDIADVIDIVKKIRLPLQLNRHDFTQRMIYAAGWNGLPEMKSKREGKN